jgi:hypothetical protein
MNFFKIAGKTPSPVALFFLSFAGNITQNLWICLQFFHWMEKSPLSLAQAKESGIPLQRFLLPQVQK